MFFRFGSLFLMIGSVLPLVSARYRAYSGGPIPIGFMHNPGVRRGYRRGRNYFYLGGFFLFAFGFLYSFKPSAPTWKIIELIFIAAWVILFFLFVLQVTFNWPKVWIDPGMRDDEGSLVLWWHKKTGKAPRRAPGERVPASHAAPIAPVEPTPKPVGQHAPEGSTGSVTIHRRREVYGMAAWYRVLVDGKPAGRLRVGKELTLELPAGEHMFQAKSGPSSSAVLRQFVAPDATLRIEVSHTPLGEDETLIDQALANHDILRLTVEMA